jgi:hypothetical protein
MTARILERGNSRPFTFGPAPVAELVYTVVGAADHAEVRDLVASTAPTTWEDLVLEYINADPDDSGTLWTCTARYSLRDADTDLEWDTTGGQSRITTSLGTITRVARSGWTAPNYLGAINVREDRVEGVDITVPVYNFGKSISLPAATVDATFRLNVYNLTGKVNSLSFLGFAAGEVLFLGATGRKRGRDKWRIDYRFAASPNAAALQVGGVSSFTVAKAGWDYLWVRFDDSLDASRVIKIPTAAYVERVYPRADLNALGL